MEDIVIYRKSSFVNIYKIFVILWIILLSLQTLYPFVLNMIFDWDSKPNGSYYFLIGVFLFNFLINILLFTTFKNNPYIIASSGLFHINQTFIIKQVINPKDIIKFELKKHNLFIYHNNNKKSFIALKTIEEADKQKLRDYFLNTNRELWETKKKT